MRSSKPISFLWLAAVNVLWLQQFCLAQLQFRRMDCRPAFACQSLRCDPLPKQFMGRGDKSPSRDEYPITCKGMMAIAASHNISERIDELQEMINQTDKDASRQRILQQNLLKKKISEVETKTRQNVIRDTKTELGKIKVEIQEDARKQIDDIKRKVRKEADNEFKKANRTAELAVTKEEDSLDLSISEESDGLRDEIWADMAGFEERMRNFITSSVEEAITTPVLATPTTIATSRSSATPRILTPDASRGRKIKCYDYVEVEQMAFVRDIQECDEGSVCARYEFIGSYGPKSTRTSRMVIRQCFPSCKKGDCKSSSMSFVWFDIDRNQINLGEEIESCEASCCSTDLCNG